MMSQKNRNLNRRQFMATSTCGIAGIVLTPGWISGKTTNKENTDFFKIRGGIPNSQYFFKENTAGNQYLFFIGNSVIDGAGLESPELRYSAQMVNGFKKFFPATNMPERRNCQPGGSWFAQYRCAHGQPVFGEVIFSGHLAVLDFAADDRKVDIDKAKCTIEAVVRQITLFRNTHSRILVYTLTPEILQSYQNEEEPEYIRISEQIAEHYGIPSLNLAKYAASKIISGEIPAGKFSTDGINPTDQGAAIYAEAVSKFVDVLMTAYPVPEKAEEVVLPPQLFAGTNDNGRIIAYEDPVVERSGGWQMGQKSPIISFRHILVSGQPGASIKLKFKGTEVGIIDIADKDTADLEYAVDGRSYGKLSSPVTDTPVMRPIALVTGLDRETEHEFVLKVSSSGVARIGGILVNGTVADLFGRMSRLEQIDAIYSTMDPVVYQPPVGRFVNIPKTRRTLENGGELRMVLLGDSIMGNTSSSSFELLLMRNHPACNIQKIASLRSGTGCRYYKEENRVKEYVLDHNPDLLIIGGISNGDAESVRTVIKQVRAKKPDTEILLLTPVFGAYKDEQIKMFTPEIDTSSSNFRYDLMKVAADEKCAFFDMTGPLWEYVRNSGKTPGWFMADNTHANARGSQIIGRLLEAWFS